MSACGSPARSSKVTEWLGVFTLGVVALAFSVAGAEAEPVVPGFDVTVYASVIDPIRMTFDPSGVLYVGRDNTGSGGTSVDAVRIHRIAAGGSPVVEYGAGTILDPDAVAFDATGTIGGGAGSILVGSHSRISSIHPDQSIAPVFSGGSLGNIGEMLFDGAGRLLFTSEDFGNVQVSMGGFPTVLFTLSAATYDIDVDASDNICTAAADGVIRFHSPSGSLLDDDFATGLDPFPQFAIGRGGAFGGSVYVIKRTSSDLLRIEANGSQTVIGMGFGVISDMAFGPDQALYVAEFDNDRILRIAASLVDVHAGAGVRLSPSYPNPFASRTTRLFALTKSGFVSIRMYDTSGRVVISLVNSWLTQGQHSVEWDGRDAHGREVPAGIYLMRVEPAKTLGKVVKLR